MGTVGNLLKSKARVLIAPVGESLPDETSVDYDNSWGGNWVDFGFTKTPLAFNYEYDEHEFHTEQILGPVRRDKTGERATFETTLSEVTSDNLNYAFGTDPSDANDGVTDTAAGASQKAFSDQTVGNTARVDEYAVGIEGQRYDSAGTGQPVRIFFAKATLRLNGALEFSQKSDDHTGIALQIKALANASTGRLFQIQEVTAPAS
jgi:hypothetical protein